MSVSDPVTTRDGRPASLAVSRAGAPRHCVAWIAVYAELAAVRRLVHLSSSRASRTDPRLGRRRRVLRLRVAEGADAARPRRLRRRHRPLVLHAGAHAPHPGRQARVGRQRAGGAARHRHAVLLVLGRAAVHRLRHGRRAARRDLLVPHLGADGQRGRPGAALRPLRLEGGRPLPGHRPAHRHRLRVDHRAAAARALTSRTGSSRRGQEAPASTEEQLAVGGPRRGRLAGGEGHRRQGLAVRAGRHRRRRRHPRLRAGELHGVHHGQGRLVDRPGRGAHRHPDVLERRRHHPGRAGAARARARRSAPCSRS